MEARNSDEMGLHAHHCGTALSWGLRVITGLSVLLPVYPKDSARCLGPPARAFLMGLSLWRHPSILLIYIAWAVNGVLRIPSARQTFSLLVA